MAQVINTNTMSLNAQRNLGTSGNSLATSIQRLSSGLRINSAKDDAAGLAISERFTTQVRGMNQASRNANDGISLAQTAEGALGEIGNNLQRIRELAVQSRNATNSDSDRQALNSEVQLLKAEIQRVAEQTNFNGTKLLDGSFQSQSFQIGANQGQTIDIAQIANANIASLGNWNKVDTAAKMTGAAPAGAAGAGGGAATPGTATLDLSAVDVEAEFNFTVDGADVTVAAGVGRSAADFATAVAAAINGEATGLATVDGTNVALSNTTAAAVELAGDVPGGVTTVAAQTAGGAAGANTFSSGSFTLTGSKGSATINFGEAGSSAQRADELVKSINAQSYNTGVSASLDSGKLVLTGADGNVTVAAGGGSDAAGLLAQTGLTAGSTAASAVGTAWAAGAADTGFDDLDISDVAGADNALKAMDAALDSINSARADLGAVQNRFTSVVANLSTSSENMSAARSRIRDTDYASETAELTRNQILQQAGTAMLAQANQSSQNVLSLLR
ncbi:flagellin [Stenotrophomonas sp. CFBP8980]|jgi:flagellin|uniref:flagellin N-terminal helical domain-containing protein n=1 Tax=Stenotrophomonas sp. CFBP8980 TaxID=3096523 RepID=UPI002A6A02A6|nr:flagellin [Stenotrophomonas sp. CFBP8980]MDY1033939.1 flagellin [Stenotrophomonas sp. CFBP8980]